MKKTIKLEATKEYYLKNDKGETLYALSEQEAFDLYQELSKHFGGTFTNITPTVITQNTDLWQSPNVLKGGQTIKSGDMIITRQDMKEGPSCV